MVSDARTTVDAVVAAVLEGKNLPVELFELQNCLVDLEREEGEEWDTGANPDFVYSNLDLDWDKDSLDWIEGNLSEERQDALKSGAEPTKEEIELYRQAYLDYFFSDPLWDGAYELRTVTDSKGRQIVAVLNKTGGGGDYEECIDDLFITVDEARKTLESYHTIFEEF